MELKNSGKLKDDELSQSIIGAAIEVHKSLGPGFVESFYEEALCIEFNTLGIHFERQKIVEVSYRGNIIGEHRLDFLVHGIFVVELKAVKELEPIHFTVVRSYMKATGASSGLLLNFSSMPLTIKRVGPDLAPTIPLSFLSS